MTRGTDVRPGRLFSRAQRPATAVAALIALMCCGAARADVIHDAAKKGDLSKVRQLVEHDPRLVNIKDKFGDTPLHIAAGEGHKDIVVFLLDNKADVNAQNNNRETPLHWAAFRGRTDVVRVLLSYHADVNARDWNGDTPLHSAAAGGHELESALLVGQGADWKAQNNNGETPGDEALEHGQLSTANFFRFLLAATEARKTPAVTDSTPPAVAGAPGATSSTALAEPPAKPAKTESELTQASPLLPDAPALDKKTEMHLRSLGFTCNTGAFTGGACRELSKLLRESPDEVVRRAVVTLCVNQSLLAQAAVEDRDPKVRKIALSKLKDEAVLAKIAISDTDAHLRSIAATRLADRSIVLGDQSQMQRVVVEATDVNVRSTTVPMLMDQTLVAKIAAEDPDPDVRRVAAESRASYNRETGFTPVQAASLFRSFVRATYFWPTVALPRLLPMSEFPLFGQWNEKLQSKSSGIHYLYKQFNSVDVSGYTFTVVPAGEYSFSKQEGLYTVGQTVFYQAGDQTPVHVSYTEVAVIQIDGKLVLLKSNTGDTLDSFYPERMADLKVTRLLAALHTLCPNAK